MLRCLVIDHYLSARCGGNSHFARFEPDLFWVGAVLYEMATGGMPFTGPTAGVIRSAILRRDPVPPFQVNAEISPSERKIPLPCGHGSVTDSSY
jgi:hypothetical protein